MLSIVCYFFSFAVSAQDFHLSQYEEAPLNLNPALTGFYNGTFRLHTHYRSQWAAITNNPYTTALFSGEQHLKKISVGGQISNQRAGTGNYNVLSVQFSSSYDKPFDYKKYHRIAGGLQAGFVYKSINISKLTFESQYYNTSGGGFDNTIPNGESNLKQSVFMPDLNAGLIYYYSKLKTRFNPFIGITIFHLNNPKESFYSQSNKLPMRFLAHGGCKINITDKFQLVPKFLFMQQKNASEIMPGIDSNFYLQGYDAFLILGSSYRNKDAMIFLAGLKYGRYTYKVSYDINNSTLYPATSGRGGFEISITMIGSRYKPTPIPNCPRPI